MENKDKKTAFQQLLDEGQTLYDNGNYKDAVKLYKTAFIMKKDMDKTERGALCIRLANTYYKLDDRDNYTYFYEEYLKDFPQGQASVFTRLAHAYYYLDADKCIDYHNKALNSEVNNYDVASKLFSLIKSAYYTQQDIKDESEYEVEQLRNTIYNNIKKYSHNDKKKKKNKKLNVAYLSSDCHAHTMMNYILPIWKNHNKDEFNFFIFNGSDKQDSTSQEIENLGFEIIKCSNMDNKQLAEAIYNKQIDILVDLGGYTHLKSFCALYKPAPVIISYLGYLNTLGIKEVDYILTDRFTIPEENAYLYTEKPLYLDKGYQIFTEKNIPPTEDNPFKNNGYITFGAFNCTSKYNDSLIFLWSKILEGCSNSKLLIYRTKLTKKIIKQMREQFKKWGISNERLMFSSKVYSPHFKAYSLADISLDPYPFNGMSITIETALMGVPTITLLGEGMQSRGAGRINHILGLDELNADCGENYIKIAVELANNKQKLDNLRKTLRDKVNNSDLRQSEKDFTLDLEDKYKKAWKDFTDSP